MGGVLGSALAHHHVVGLWRQEAEEHEPHAYPLQGEHIVPVEEHADQNGAEFAGGRDQGADQRVKVSQQHVDEHLASSHCQTHGQQRQYHTGVQDAEAYGRKEAQRGQRQSPEDQAAPKVDEQHLLPGRRPHAALPLQSLLQKRHDAVTSERAQQQELPQQGGQPLGPLLAPAAAALAQHEQGDARGDEHGGERLLGPVLALAPVQQEAQHQYGQRLCRLGQYLGGVVYVLQSPKGAHHGGGAEQGNGAEQLLGIVGGQDLANGPALAQAQP